MSKQECVRIQKVKPSDEELCKIASKSIAQMMRFSLNEDFRQKIFRALQVSSTNQAEEQIRLKLASMVCDETENQNQKASSSENSTSSFNLQHPLYPNYEPTGCTKFKDGLVRHDVPNENNSDGTFCKEGGNIQHYSDSIVSTVSVEATLINLMNSNYRSSEVTCEETTENQNSANHDLINHQKERVLKTKNSSRRISKNKKNFKLQKENSQSASILEREHLKISSNDVDNYIGNHSEQGLSSESQQSTNSQSSSLSQEIFEKNWLEISSTTKCFNGKRNHRDWERKKSDEFNYFKSNSQDMLCQDSSPMNQSILTSYSQDFLNEESFSVEEESKFKKTLKWNEQNFLEVNLKRQKTQNSKCSLLMDL